jgi:signal transduction histidine kinase
MPGTAVPDKRLKNCAFFKDFTEDSLKSIAAITSERTFPAHTAVFQEGDFGDSLYIVKKGRVAIQKKDRYGIPVNIAVYGEGEVIGDMALIDEQPRSATLMTLEKTTFYVIQGSHFQLFLYGQREVTRSTLYLLSQRIRNANEKLIFNALDDHPDMVLLVDKNFRITHINKEAQNKLGISHEHTGNGHVISSLKILLGKLQSHGSAFQRLTWILFKPDRLYLSVHFSPMETESGDVFGYLIELRDITVDRNRARRHLEVASFISHKIASLISEIKLKPGNGEAMSHEPELKRALTVETLLRQIDKLVAFTDLEAGPLRIDPEPIDPESILRKVLAELRVLCDMKQQNFNLQFEFGGAKISADEEWLEKLFSFLIDNAIRYSEPGETIKIGTFQSPSGSFVCRIENPTTGILKESECGKFFDLSVQLDEFEKQKISEFGLDLPLARHIVEAHHGKIQVEPNLANRFCVLLEIP